MKTKKIVLTAAAAVLAVLSAAVLLMMKAKTDSLEHENSAEKFSAGERYSQMTLFIPESAEFTIDKVMYFRYNLEKALTDKSLSAPSGARLYVDAYSAQEDVTFQSQSLRTSKAKVTYIGGDYKLFHSELDGLPDICSDVNHDRVLLSKTAAWQLYGGYELYDFAVTDTSEKTLYISGVFDDYSGGDYEKYYDGKSAVFADITDRTDMPITCYEIILPDPVKNFALDTVKECIGLAEGTYLLVENSKRFSLSNVIDTAKNLVGADEQLPAGVEINPVEMMARRAEKELAVMLVIFAVLAVFPALTAVFWIWKLIRLIKKLLDTYVVRKIKDKLSYS